MKSKRELKNFVINRPFQLRMAVYFVSGAILLVGLMTLLMNRHMNDLREIITSASEISVDTQIALEQIFSRMLVTSLLFLVTATMATALYAIVVSHRIAGPMHAILSYINVLKAGKFDQSRTLRPNDELQPIMESLNELAAQLKKK